MMDIFHVILSVIENWMVDAKIYLPALYCNQIYSTFLTVVFRVLFFMVLFLVVQFSSGKYYLINLKYLNVLNQEISHLKDMQIAIEANFLN